MPTILKFKNIKFVIVPGDHDPPHVHVVGKNAIAKYQLKPIKCFASYGFSLRALNQIEKQLRIHQDLLLEAWSEWQS